MIDERIAEQLSERIVQRLDQANERVLQRIGKNIKKIGTLTETDAYRIIQTMKYGGDYNKIVKELSRVTKINQKEIKKILEEVAKKNLEFKKEAYEYRNKKYLSYDQNKELKQHIEYLANITANEYKNLTNIKYLGYAVQDLNGDLHVKGLKDAFNDVMDTAVINVLEGKESFDEAMFGTLKALGGSGLRVIPHDYAITNRTRRLDTSVRQLLSGAIRDAQNECQRIIGEQIGADGWEVSVHEYPAPDHASVQGKQFSKEEFEKFQNHEDSETYDGIAIEQSTTKRRKISEYNCYHIAFTVILGLDKPQYSNEELQKINERNEKGFEFDGKTHTMYWGTQMQRKLETEIRKQKDTQILAITADDKELIIESQKNIKGLMKRYRKLCSASGLSPKADRLRVVNYHYRNYKEMNEE